jgi:hypothetical protein
MGFRFFIAACVLAGSGLAVAAEPEAMTSGDVCKVAVADLADIKDGALTVTRIEPANKP